MQLAALADLVGSTVTAQAAVPGGPTLFLGERGTRRVPLADYLTWLRVLEGAFPDRAELAQRLRLLYYPSRFNDVLETDLALATLPATSTAEVRAAWESLLHAGYVVVPVGPARYAMRITTLWPALDLVPQFLQDTMLSWAWMSPVGYVTWQGDVCRVVDEWLLRRLRNPTLPADETLNNAPGGGWVTRSATQRAPREDLRGSIDALVVSEWARRVPATPVSTLLERYYAFGPPAANEPSAANRLDSLVAADPSMRPTAVTRTEASIQKFVTVGLPLWAHYYQQDRRGSHLSRFLGRVPEPRQPWFELAFTALVLMLVRTLMAADQWTLSVEWPAQPDPLYGGYDLGVGDDDTALRYGGAVQAADPGGHVAALVADLTSADTAVAPGLGFDGTTGDPNTTFGEKLGLLVREFQIEAGQKWMWARTAAGGWERRPAYRRYRGPVHGIVDWETRQALQLWLNRPDFATANPTDPPTPLTSAGLTRVANGLRVFSAAPANPALNMTGNWWWWDDEPNAAPRVYAQDRLRRHAIPAGEQLGGDPEVVALGSWTNNPFAPPAGGPVLVHDRGTWASARLTIARLEAIGQFRPAGDALRRDAESTYAVVYAMSAPEIAGCLDSYTGWDIARMSFGLCHWTLRLEQAPAVTGELASLLAWHKDHSPAAFRDDFGVWGLDVDGFATLPQVSPGKVTGPVMLYGVERVTAGTAAAIPGARPELMEWLRSWRSVFRILHALRTSDGLTEASWRLARRRLRLLMAEPWSADPARNADITDVAGNAAAFGDFVNSEAAAAALMRWHINQPGRVFPPGAVETTVQAAVRTALAAAGIATPTTAVALAASAPFASALVDALVDPALPAAGTVNAAGAVAARIPDLGNRRPNAAPGSLALWSAGT